MLGSRPLTSASGNHLEDGTSRKDGDFWRLKTVTCTV